MTSLVLLVFTGCRKNSSSDIPPLTHSGTDFMFCKVNGKPLQVNGFYRNSLSSCGVIFNPPDVNNMIYIAGNNCDPHYYFTIRFVYEDSLGLYNIVSSPYPLGAGIFSPVISTIPNSGNQYNTDSTHTGTVSVFYYGNGIISGRFQFDAVNGQGDVIHVTDGEFDIGQK